MPPVQTILKKNYASSAASGNADEIAAKKKVNFKSWLTEKIPNAVAKKDWFNAAADVRNAGGSGCECVSGVASVLRCASLTSQVVCVYPYPLTKAAYLEQPLEEAMNCYGEVCHVEVLETTKDCGRSLQGVLSAQQLSTSVLCSSTSLVEMFPKICAFVKQRVPCVFHVSAFGLDNDNLSTVSDYSHMLQVGSTGIALLNSTSVQECHDLAIVAHLVATRAEFPIVHFFDGPRLGSEISKIHVLPPAELAAQLSAIPPHGRVVKKQLADVIDGFMDRLAEVFGRRYNLFEYAGHPSAEVVLISFCSKDDTSTLANVVSKLSEEGKRVGLIIVRLLRPWSAKHLLKFLPNSLKCCAVLTSANATAQRQLFSDVSSSLYQYPQFQHCKTVSVARENSSLNEHQIQSLLQQLQKNQTSSPVTLTDEIVLLQEQSSSRGWEKVVVWNSIADGEAACSAGMSLLRVVGGSTAGFVHGSQVVDHYVLGGAAAVSHLSFSQSPFQSPTLDSAASCVVCTNVDLLAQFNVAGKLTDGGMLVLDVAAELSNSDLDALIPAPLRQEIALRNLRLHLVDTKGVLQKLKAAPQHAGLFLQMIILRASGLCQSLDQLRSFLKTNLAPAAVELGSEVFDEMLEIAMVEGADAADIPEAWKFPPALDEEEETVLEGKEKYDEEEEQEEEEVEEKEVLEEKDLEEKALPVDILRPSLLPAFTSVEETRKYSVSGAHKAAWLMMYPEAHATKKVLKPFEHETTYLVKTTLKKRLTPGNYSRNVYHIEFDLGDTGLTYDIGEALGIYGHNRAVDVEQFIALHKFDPEQIVSTTNGKGEVEMRTVEQVFTQELDLFGRPGRRFYEALAEYAEDPKEKKKLEWLAGPEGGPEFKKGVEQLVNYADLLKKYKSVRMSVEDLVREVPRIKPRHYSIASSMKAHPTSVHLLVVVVEWEAQGEARFGLCSNYLDNLEIGEMVTVDVKPSVMKLPKETTAPLMMAGLGTGMAPFRAFIEERAWQRDQGMPVGPITLYFGSRSQYQEYLYGEELEAYHASGLLTNLRCAFSRDQEHKIYIQHKMQEDAQIIVDDLMTDKTGCFYLCGPTWPAGDVQDAIKGALQNIGGLEEEEATHFIRDMKETERYVLEVY